LLPVNALKEGEKESDVGRKVKTKATTVEVGRDERGVAEFLDSRGTTKESSLKTYAQVLGMLRNRTDRALLDLDAAGARGLAAEVKRMKGAQFLCAIARSFYTHHEKADLAKFFKVARRSNAVGPDDVPTDDEVDALIQAAGSIRDRALIATFAECGV